MVAGSTHFDKEQDPDPDYFCELDPDSVSMKNRIRIRIYKFIRVTGSKQSLGGPVTLMRSRIRICIKVKSWIRIRLK